MCAEINYPRNNGDGQVDVTQNKETSSYLNAETIEQLIESITQEVAGDADELTYAQAQEITWRLSQVLAKGPLQ